ncbi:MAG: CBS domain-containing protein [Ramlibacter sp.]|nr:CBS domain-containing protein [Ramlibacter sp.]
MTAVSKVMTRGVRTLTPSDTLAQAARVMEELNVGVIPVCEGEKLVGVVTDRDIVVRGLARALDANSTQLKQVMSTEVRCATEEQDLDQVLKTMANAQIRRMPVVDAKQRLVGIVSIGDIAAKDRHNDADLAESLGDISAPSTGKTRGNA